MDYQYQTINLLPLLFFWPVVIKYVQSNIHSLHYMLISFLLARYREYVMESDGLRYLHMSCFCIRNRRSERSEQVRFLIQKQRVGNYHTKHFTRVLSLHHRPIEQGFRFAIQIRRPCAFYLHGFLRDAILNLNMRLVEDTKFVMESSPYRTEMAAERQRTNILYAEVLELVLQDVWEELS